MKRIFVLALLALMLSTTSCERVAPNFQGVLMENFGQNGKSDFSLVKGRVMTFSPGKELFQAPLFKQRGGFETSLDLKASNNTQFGAMPKYSYEVIPNRAIDVVFLSVRIESGSSDMMRSIEDNILEPIIDDLIKEYSRSYHTDDLMKDGGQLAFEKDLEVSVSGAFEAAGFKLLTFQSQLEFSKKVTDKIDQRNEVNSNMTVIDRQIQEQIKQNELQQLITDHEIIRSKGITNQTLQKDFIDKWDGSTPLYGSAPFFLKQLK